MRNSFRDPLGLVLYKVDLLRGMRHLSLSQTPLFWERSFFTSGLDLKGGVYKLI
jgi:hypothetical protein